MREYVMKKEIKNKKSLDEPKIHWDGSPYCTGPNMKPIIDSGFGGNVLIFKDEFNCENITRLIKSIEKVRQNGYEHLTLYFDSEGGVVADMFVLVDYLNNLEGMSIDLISNSYLHSAGFYLYFLIDWTKPNLGFSIHDMCECSTHKSTCRPDIREVKKELLPDYTNDYYFTKNNFIDDWIYTNVMSKIDMSEEKLKYYKDGFDINMTGEEMTQYIENMLKTREEENEKEQVKILIEEIKNKGYSIEELVGEINETKC